MDSAFENLSLLEEEDDELILEPNAHPDSLDIIEFSVVGRFLITGQPINFGIMKSQMTRELPLMVPLKHICFWVQNFGLLVGYFSEDIGKALGNFIGKFLEYDLSNTSLVWREYMRVRVDIGVNEPLKCFKKIKLDSGAVVVVTFKYEKLHNLCFICGKLGHTESYCDILFNTEEGEVKREWGAFSSGG
ncbi:hypothetical protein ACS0TY_014209 [Phlomoides rotata]